MRIVAFITEPTTVRAILDHLGEPIRPPIIAPARGPPLWDVPDAAGDGFDSQAQPAPAYQFRCTRCRADTGAVIVPRRGTQNVY
jgi:hypothetical protein